MKNHSFHNARLKSTSFSNSELKIAKSLCLTASQDISKQSGGCKALLLFSFEIHKLKEECLRLEVNQEDFVPKGSELLQNFNYFCESLLATTITLLW